MRYAAGKLVEAYDVVALVAAASPTPQVCFARSAQVPVDMAQVLRAALGPYGGRGGGRPQAAQGGGVAAEQLPGVLEQAVAQVRSALAG
ncbi:MAG: DHHA1 domain-containing protein, partial [Chloroflexota bacterium]